MNPAQEKEEPICERVFSPLEYPLQASILYHDEKQNLFGCSHYRRNAKIRGSCCNLFYSCRFCHDEQTDHEINRKEIRDMICTFCIQQGIFRIQPICATCVDCQSQIARYFCTICKFFDDAPDRDIYHCSSCGICRRGRQEDYWHCDTCNSCYLKSRFKPGLVHTCIENVLAQCPICLQDLFHSVISVTMLRCGHAIHVSCLHIYQQNNTHTILVCPVCKKSLQAPDSDSSILFQRQIGDYLITHPMPEEYKQWKATVLCNDCLQYAQVSFHFSFHQCPHCKSYNTNLESKYLPGIPNSYLDPAINLIAEDDVLFQELIHMVDAVRLYNEDEL
ncbi:MAG: zf-CHY-domain-containing protein [Sylvanvirus sp.]|uniref:Zf-CHY-domain-containing protein n=1 Tax=Sylvanvirus sp. TaxID=2487774 RepID=A0A3G5AIY3_9VIRU|nr:MAG: zf-CHY-domain-containing protein [Sylvanvirus sp.]